MGGITFGAFALALLRGIHAMLHFYIPSLFIVGRNVRRLTWEGGLGGSAKGLDARVILEQCLAIHTNVLGDWQCKSEYTRTLSVALLAWQPYYSSLPGCCFVEELGEALLSKMVSRMRRNRHVVTWDGVLQLYVTVPTAQAIAPATRGALRKELVQLIRNRLCQVIRNAASQPHARVTSAQHAVWDAALPATFTLPTIPHNDQQNFVPVLRRAVVILSSGPPATGPLRQFAIENFPADNQMDLWQRRQLAEQHLATWRRQRRPPHMQAHGTQSPRSPVSPAALDPTQADVATSSTTAAPATSAPAQPRPQSPANSEDDHRYSPPRDSAGGSLYEPPSSDDVSVQYSGGYHSSDDLDSLGSTGELVTGRRGQWGAITEEDLATYLRELGMYSMFCVWLWCSRL